MTHYLHSYTLRACRQREKLPPDLKAVLDEKVRWLTRHPETGWHPAPDEEPGLWRAWAGSALWVTYQLVADPDQVVVLAVERWHPAFAYPGAMDLPETGVVSGAAVVNR
jgi:hypothetical protein